MNKGESWETLVALILFESDLCLTLCWVKSPKRTNLFFYAEVIQMDADCRLHANYWWWRSSLQKNPNYSFILYRFRGNVFAELNL